MEKTNNQSRKMPIAIICILLAVSLLLVGGFVFNMFIDYIQFREIGVKYIYVFWKNFYAKILSQSAAFLIAFVALFVNVLIMRTNALSINKENRVFKKILPLGLACFIVSFLLSMAFSQNIYDKILSFISSTPFNIGDPVFNKDIGYYIFQRPFFVELLEGLTKIWLFIIPFIVVSYIILYSVQKGNPFPGIFKDRFTIIHIGSNIMIFFLFKCFSYRFMSENILFSTFGEFSGAGFTDIYVWKLYYKIAPVVILAIILLCLIFLKSGKYKNAIMSVAVYPALFVLALLVSFFVQRLYVSPNEVAVEEPYIKNNIEATRAAYNLNNTEEREYPISYNLTAEDLSANSATIENIRITDYNQTLTVVNQLQGIRNYYTFLDSDVALYNINGKKVALNTSVRELNKENLDAATKKYINRKLRYTHGFGMVMSPLNSVTEQGQPKFWVKDIPAHSYNGAPKINQPRIYFGELTDDYVIVNSYQKEFDYSESNADVEYSYTGVSGIPMTFKNRLAFSIKYGDVSMLISRYINSESRLLLNRNIIERVKKIAPFLTYDSDPYAVIDENGNIKWLIDGYTTSDSYPYSQTYNGINYIRNSVKVVVDAYNGTVDFYIVDKTDPIVLTYDKIYPTLFCKEEMPIDLKTKVRYPDGLFKIQASVFARYHTTNPKQLYSKADLWAIAKERYGENTEPIKPYYNLMKLSETAEEELILMIPYTLENKDNMVSWLAVRSEGENYGKMISYIFSKGENVYGPLQVESRIDNDPKISREISLWNQGGSTVIRGNLLVIPVKNSILYVEPLYITSSNTASLPEVKRIIVAYGEEVVMAENLAKALEELFSAKLNVGTESTETNNTPMVEDDIGELIDKAVNVYDNVLNEMKNGNWEAFGKGMNEMSSILSLLKEKNSD